jgi:integrase
VPAPRKNELIQKTYFLWRLGKRHGIYVADGRSKKIDVGRHSLGVRGRDEALAQLTRLDAVKAVEFGIAPQSILNVAESEMLSLEEGKQLYLAHAGRAPVLGGASAATVKRYRPVLAKFIAYGAAEGIRTWQAVTKKILEAYAAWLVDKGYHQATQRFELTVLKQVIKWLVGEKKLPTSCLVQLPLKKARGTTTYCYRPEEVQAMVERCSGRTELNWLGDVIVALVTTGLRISELANLRWDDLDMRTGMLRLTDTRYQGNQAAQTESRTTKSHRDRTLPIHVDLRRLLEAMKHHADGRVFHGPHGGKLKPDTVRTILVRDVLAPLAPQFPAPALGKGFGDGRVHSLRHYFCSISANSGVPEQVLMTWLGHRDSSMVHHYYHLHDDEARRQMARIQFIAPMKNGSKSE